MSIRLGRSRTCSIREKDLRARGEATLVVKRTASLGTCENQANAGRAEAADGRNVGATRQGTGSGPLTASESPRRAPDLTGRV